ncbi:hypothetical protein SAMN05443287_10263 [Micromonospora phaseoli]|uniref:Uncharacterized protein n=1 Tax=Micromonospora phaseoli TaxID=1144548 RepID=A0A1H6U8T8_9ACTN|nr:hypothetical protein [Micromonospora phaseoli]PZV98828.1 hypothetical protein CLV64_10464 [Micromonospora phaseoli]GIJ76421.1 hypothetical protein Xph01_08530 [Micromonospora phaseoli]SEI86037.1 hypothetical protein SAMN05443287_10263 [Micromonospora phaseoli]
MSEPSINYGIQQSGGVSQVGNQAVGPGAVAVGGALSATAPGVDVPALVAQLVEALDQHRDELPEQARAVAAELRAQLARPDPEPARVTALLRRLAELAAPVAPVASAVTEVLRAVQQAT